MTSHPRLGRLLRGPFAPALLLALYPLMAVSATLSFCTTSDEIAHLTAGYSYWRWRDFRLNPENGHLPQRVVGLPLVLAGFRFPPLDTEAWRRSDVWSVGASFFYEMGNDLDRLLVLGRLSTALLGTLLLGVIYAWSRRLYGPAGGLLSLALAAFSPELLAHGALATSDAAAALLFTVAVGGLWRASQRLTPWSLASSLGATGLLALAKMSAPLFVPMAIVLAALRCLGRTPLEVRLGAPREVASRPGKALVLALVLAAQGAAALGAIWAAHGFRYSAFAPGATGPAEPASLWPGWQWARGAPGEGAIGLARRHHLLPEAYLYGLAHTLKMSASRRAFLRGEYGVTGWPWFFPYALLVKTPIPLQLAVLAALWAAVTPGRPLRARIGAACRASPLLALAGVYGLFALRSHLNIGLRHLLPVYPAVLILAGGAVRLGERGRAWRIALPLLVAWHAGGSLSIRPHYLAYFNELVGGPRNGYRHLVDSSLDWGQGLKLLGRWLAAEGLDRPGAPPVYVSYFGTGRLAHYGIRARLLPSVPGEPEGRMGLFEDLGPGVYVLSASMLQNVFTATPGPWTRWHEREYRRLGALLDGFARLSRDPAQAAGLEQARSLIPSLWQTYEQLRLGRLAAWLRRREPDAWIGYSMLVYRLGEADLRAALAGPPAELRERGEPPEL